jgi:hypothetical protein
MKRCKVPLLLVEALEELRANLEEDLDHFWPAPEGKGHDEGREMHEANMILHLGAILKKSAHIYTEVSTDDHSNKDIDFVALPRKEDWFLICEAKRGYGTNHVLGILRDIERILSIAKSKTFQAYEEYSKSYGLILITLWSKSDRRALINAWENDYESTNTSPIGKACKLVIKKLDNVYAERGVLKIHNYGNEGKHYLLYAVFEINQH